MFGIIEITCPYCSITGQIMAPPSREILIGPCPGCNEMVVIYNEQIEKIDGDIILNGTTEEKRTLFITVLMDFVINDIDNCVLLSPKIDATTTKKMNPSIVNENKQDITDDEVNDFKRIDLALINKKGYLDEQFKGRK